MRSRTWVPPGVPKCALKKCVICWEHKSTSKHQILKKRLLEFCNSKQPTTQISNHLYNSTRVPLRGHFWCILDGGYAWYALTNTTISESLEWKCECECKCKMNMQYEPKLCGMRNTSRNGYGGSHIQKYSRMK